MTDDLCFRSATELATLLRSGDLSARDLLTAHLARIEAVNPQLNALVTLVPEQAQEAALAADETYARSKTRSEPLGPLHGLPFAIKDMVETAGIRTTYGSPIYADHVPTLDALTVQRMKAAGGILLGKSNTPEFAAGSQTFNPVFGATRNPYDPTRTCGGSSGGAAVALASGMVPLADGSDLGGSLRNPAGYCNVVGFRPSPGRVPFWPNSLAWDTLWVQGPMARTVADCALLLSVQAGPAPQVPGMLTDPGSRFAQPLARTAPHLPSTQDLQGLRVAWSRDLGGFPVDPAITTALEPARTVLQDLGGVVEDAEPDLRDAEEIFRVLRAWRFAQDHGEELQTHRALMKDTVIWNTEEGLRLRGTDVSRAEVLRGKLFERVADFFTRYDLLALPVAQVPPFDLDIPYPTEINGQPLRTYLDWMGVCWAITVTACPAISVPGGFTPEGLPVGLQLVAAPQADFFLLQAAHAFEQATRWGDRRPGSRDTSASASS